MEIINRELLEEQLNIGSLDWINTYPIEFKNLKFEVEPGFHPKTLESGKIIETKYTSKQISIDGFNYILVGRDDILETKYSTSRAMNLYLGKEENYINSTIEISEDAEDIITETSIVRHDPQKNLPRGLGRIFSEETVKFLQNLATKTGKPVLHRVDRSPGYDGVELSEIEWDRMFIPKLEKAGYERTTENNFSKIFYPENQQDLK